MDHLAGLMVRLDQPAGREDVPLLCLRRPRHIGVICHPGFLAVVSTEETAVSDEPSEVVYSTSTVGFADPEPPRLVPAAPTPTEKSPSARLSDAALGARARDGDVDAFEELLRTHQAELYRLAFRMLGDRDQAQEVVVSTLLEGWRRLAVSPTSMSFRIWMSRSAMRQCLKLLADPPTDPAAASAELTLVKPSTDGEVVDPADRSDLDVALDTLSAAERACWVLKDLHGMSDIDISHAMGVNEASVPGRVTQARQHLITSLAAA